MLSVKLSGEAHEAVPLPIPPQASEALRRQAEKIRTIWADQGDDGDLTSRMHRGETGKVISMPCRSIADVAAKLSIALHEVSPCTTRGAKALAFDPGDLPTENAAPLLVSVLNDLLRLIDPPSWEEALAEYHRLKAISDAMPLGADGEDEAIDAYCDAMDELVLRIAPPSPDALATKIRLIKSRFGDLIDVPPEYIEAIMAGAAGLLLRTFPMGETK